jgi:hypothetical protein
VPDLQRVYKILILGMLLDKMDKIKGCYALTRLRHVRHTKRVQLSGFIAISYGMKLWCPVDSDAWQRDVRHTKRIQLSRYLCNIVHYVWGFVVVCW